MKPLPLLAALSFFSLSGRLLADHSPTQAHPSYKEAMAEAPDHDRDDPEVKAAVAAVRAIAEANQGKQAQGVDPLEIEEAQLNLELILLKKAKVRRPGAKGLLEQRQQEIETRVSGIGTERKRKPSKAKGGG